MQLAGRPGEDLGDAQLHTSRLQLDTVTEIADTRSPVELAFGASRMRAIGMRADLKAGPSAWNPKSMAASSRSCFAPPCLVACAAAAGAQEREQLPIEVEGTVAPTSTTRMACSNSSAASRSRRAQIRISADSAVANSLDFEDSNWEFSGTVRISMPDSRIASDTARVRFSGGEIASATVTGAPATFEQQREEEQAEGRANRIDYDLKRGAVELAGDAWLSSGGNGDHRREAHLQHDEPARGLAGGRWSSRSSPTSDEPAETPKPQP